MIKIILAEVSLNLFSLTLRKEGMKAQDICELFFENVKVPKENLLGEEGKVSLSLRKIFYAKKVFRFRNQ